VQLQGKDVHELRRHIYSNSVDRPSLRKLIRKIFRTCKCPVGTPCNGHEVAFSVDEMVNELDLPQENISTLLCHLETDPKNKFLDVLPLTYATCSVSTYVMPQNFADAVKKVKDY